MRGCRNLRFDSSVLKYTLRFEKKLLEKKLFEKKNPDYLRFDSSIQKHIVYRKILLTVHDNY